MQFSYFIKNKSKIILLLCLFLLIILISGIIIFLDNNNQNRVSSNNVAVDFGLKDYAKLKADVNNLFSDPTISQNPSYTRFIQRLTKVEDNTISAKDKYQSLSAAYIALDTSYAQTNNHALYGLLQEFNNFVKANFSTYYKQNDFFRVNCADKTCADEPQSPEILKIVDKINTSSIPDVVKKTFSNDLLNVGYISKNDSKGKALNYIMVASIFNGSGALTDAGLNIKLSQEIIDYVQQAYPTEYKNYQNAK